MSRFSNKVCMCVCGCVQAARAERLGTHVRRVHHKQACARCAHVADDAPALHLHLRDAQYVSPVTYHLSALLTYHALCFCH